MLDIMLIIIIHMATFKKNVTKLETMFFPRLCVCVGSQALSVDST